MKKTTFQISFDIGPAIAPITAANLATFFGCIDRLYKILLTFIKKDYFIDRWIRGEIPEFKTDDLFTITTISKNSPGQITGTAIREVVTALSDVLSLGKQVENYRMADIRVEEAKLTLERKKREFEDEERKRILQDNLTELDLEIEKEKRLLELEKLRTQRDEEVKKRRQLTKENIDAQIELLSKGIKVLSQVPENIITQLKAALGIELEEMKSSGLEISEFKLLK